MPRIRPAEGIFWIIEPSLRPNCEGIL